jgi:hypothetical protein
MNTLIISDRLTGTDDNPDIDLYSWTHDRPSASNYQYIVLDLYFGKPNPAGYVSLNGYNHDFYEIGNEVLRSLNSGGIVIALLGPVALSDRKIGENKDEVLTYSLKREGTATYATKYKERHETSYDWLDQGFLKGTKIDALHKKRSSDIDVLAHWEEAQEYFKNVSHFWTSIDGLGLRTSPTQATLTYRVEEGERWNIMQTVCQHKAWILASSKHSREPIAIVTNYLQKPGLLVLLPPFYIPKGGSASDLSNSLKIERILVEFANSIKEQTRGFEITDIPDWAKKHRSSKATSIATQIEKLNSESEALRTELTKYDDMLLLLCAKGDLLQRQVQRLFDNPSQGISAEPTQAGHSLDLFVKDKSGRTLAIEITGTKGKLTKNDHHWADFLHYLPEHNSKNQNGRIERIVLIVNTQIEEPLEKRSRKDDITSPVLDIAKDNHICVIRSCDLYRLWLLTQEGVSLQKIFDILFEHEGIYDYDKSYKSIK